MELFPRRPSAAASTCSQRRAHTASAVAAHGDGDSAALVHVAGVRCPRRPFSCPVVSQCPSRPKCGGAVGSRRYPSSARTPVTDARKRPEAGGDVVAVVACGCTWCRGASIAEQWEQQQRSPTDSRKDLAQRARVGRIGAAQK
jgi:hypothetical protein